jgi:hypothetical protein
MLRLFLNRAVNRTRNPQSAVEFSPVELVGLEILVGFHPIDRPRKAVTTTAPIRRPALAA